MPSDAERPSPSPIPGTFIASEHVEGGIVFRRRDPHTCRTPEPRRFDIGDTFVCGSCNAEHVLEDAQQYQGGPFWKLTKRGVR